MVSLTNQLAVIVLGQRERIDVNKKINDSLRFLCKNAAPDLRAEPQAGPNIVLRGSNTTAEFDRLSGELRSYSFIPRAPRRENGDPLMSAEMAGKTAQDLSITLGFQKKDKVRVSFRPMKGGPLQDLWTGCYFILMTRTPQGVDASSNGSHVEVVVDGYTKVVRNVRNVVLSERYFGTPVPDFRPSSKSLISFAKTKGVKATSFEGGNLFWLRAATVPDHARKIKGINIKNDLILTRAYTIGELVIWTDPSTGAIQGSEQRQSRAYPASRATGKPKIRP